MLAYHLFLYLGFALLLFMGNTSLSWKSLTFDQAFMLTLIIVLCLRIIIYTDLGDRHFIAYYDLIPVLLVRRIKDLLLIKPPAN